MYKLKVSHMKKSLSSKLNLIWLLSYLSIASISAAIITPALPEIEKHYQLDVGSVEWMVSAFLIGYVIGQLLYGPLANQFGRLKALRMGLLINIVGAILCLAALHSNAYWLLIGGRFISALGAASGLACTFMLINEWLPKFQRKTAMAYSVLSFALGVGVAVIIGGIITEYSFWQNCFWVLFIHGILMLIGTIKFSETLVTPKPIHISTITHDYWAALCSSTLVTYSIVIGCCTSISYCFSASGPQIAQKVMNLSAAEYGYWNSLNVIGVFIGGLVAKQLLSRFTENKIICLGLAGIALGLANLFMIWSFGSQNPLWFFLTTASLYSLSSFLFASGSAIASNALDDKASAAAMMSFLNMSTATVAVIVIGYLAQSALLSFIVTLSILWILAIGLLLLKWLK